MRSAQMNNNGNKNSDTVAFDIMCYGQYTFSNGVPDINYNDKK